ncbi:MAG: hypothetical protein R3Y33_05680 [Clostridia bacterium]
MYIYKKCSACGKVWNVSVFNKSKKYLCPGCTVIKKTQTKKHMKVVIKCADKIYKGA